MVDDDASDEAEEEGKKEADDVLVVHSVLLNKNI